MNTCWQEITGNQQYNNNNHLFLTPVNKYKKEYYKRELSTVTSKQLKLTKLGCWAKQKKNNIMTVRAEFLSVTNKIKTDFLSVTD